jgi:photosystem II stability/assembly factor-like uncharacterized protein
MKHTSSYILVLVGLLSVRVGEAQGQRTLADPLTGARRLNDICFVGAETGTAVGTYGTILRTTDGGITWRPQSAGGEFFLNAVHFTDANTGTVVGFDNRGNPPEGIILRTTDGGGTWTRQTSGAQCMLNGVYFTNTDIGTVVGGGDWMCDAHATILRTTDGGKNWVSQLSDTTVIAFNAICLTDAITGTVLGYGKWGSVVTWESSILRTTNGGKDWLEQITGVKSQLHSVCFLDANHGTAVGGDGYLDEKGVILRTKDGGISWTKDSVSTATGIFDICFTNANTGTAVGSVLVGPYSNIMVLETTDGGSSWGEYHSVTSGGQTEERRSAVAFTDSKNGFVVSDLNIFRTTDGGNNWFKQYAATDVGEMLAHEVPTQCSLSQNYPNPFNPSTTIKFELPRSTEVRLSVSDMLGREVSVLVNERRDAGVHEVKCDGSNLSSGVYFCRLQAGDFTQTKRLLLLK